MESIAYQGYIYRSRTRNNTCMCIYSIILVHRCPETYVVYALANSAKDEYNIASTWQVEVEGEVRFENKRFWE